MLLKLEEEIRILIANSIMLGKNDTQLFTVQMWNGFSSHQLIFGKNPNLPGIITNWLPALENSTSSEILAQHLNALHDARRAYIETEANEL